MEDNLQHEVTNILQRWSGGGENAPERLMPLVYDELRRQARAFLSRERGLNTLQPTALVHEAYLKLVDQTRINWQNRAHFFGVASTVMRRIVIDHARTRPENAAVRRLNFHSTTCRYQSKNAPPRSSLLMTP